MAITNRLEDNVFSILKDYKNKCFLAAISGGADSMVLLSSLRSSAPSALRSLQVLHIEHGLRGQEGKDDAEFVRAFCEQRSIPCKIITIPPGKIEEYAKRYNTGIEAAARHFRRKALLREARKHNALILTAHTKDDALELALMRILRGAGPAGLAAMPVKRGRFIRPLLETTREEIIAYLKENDIPWREDSSNKDDRFLRNKIRHKLIPFLDSHSGTAAQWKKGVEGMAATQALVAEFLNSEAENRIVWEEVKSEKGKGKSVVTDETIFFSQYQIIREEAIYNGLKIIRANSCQFVGTIPKRCVIRRFCLGEIKSCDLGRVRLVRQDGKITLTPVKKDFSEAGISYLIP